MPSPLSPTLPVLPLSTFCTRSSPWPQPKTRALNECHPPSFFIQVSIPSVIQLPFRLRPRAVASLIHASGPSLVNVPISQQLSAPTQDLGFKSVSPTLFNPGLRSFPSPVSFPISSSCQKVAGLAIPPGLFPTFKTLLHQAQTKARPRCQTKPSPGPRQAQGSGPGQGPGSTQDQGQGQGRPGPGQGPKPGHDRPGPGPRAKTGSRARPGPRLRPRPGPNPRSGPRPAWARARARARPIIHNIIFCTIHNI